MSGHDEDGAGVAGQPQTVADAYEATSVPMCSLSWPAFEFVTTNAAYRAFSGRSDLIGRNGREMFPEFEGQQVFEMLERACATGERRVLREWRIQLETGSGVAEDYYLDLVVDPVPDAEGETKRLQVIVIDVTEQTRARLRVEAEAKATGQRLTRAMDVVGALQNALLPDGLPVLPTVDAAASYRLADDDLAAGGDWFDVLPLDDGRVGLVVGDVVGHGVEASAVMGQLRSALGSALLSGLDPTEAIGFLDRFAAHVPGARAATVVVAVLDPAAGHLTYCTAGHLPPLVVTQEGQGTYLEPTGATPLVTGSTFPSRQHRLNAGDTLMLYSDGLVERPGRPPTESMVEILQVASDAVRGRGPMTGASSSTADRVASWCVELLTRATGTSDDVTVLAAQRRPQPAPSLQLEIPAAPPALRGLRASIADWCSSLALDDTTIMVLQHAVNELATNAIEHAFQHRESEEVQGVVQVSATVSPAGLLELTVADEGRWRENTSATTSQRGHGLALVGHLLDDLKFEHGATGTVVRASYRPTRPVNLDTTAAPVDTMPTGFTIEQRDGTVVIAGALDLVSGEELRRVLMTTTQGGSLGVTVDLSAVTLLGSSAIAVLLQPWMHDSRLYAPLGSTAQHVLELVGVEYVSSLHAP